MPERRFALKARLAAVGLPPPSQDTLEALHDILDERVLGASNHVAIALPLIARIASGPDTSSVHAALETSAFIAETRGAAAPIVANALQWQSTGLDPSLPSDAAAILADRAAAWSAASAARRSALVAKAREALRNVTAPMLFDFSSTVADIAVALAADQRLDGFTIPESRAIDGGRRYIDALSSLDLPLHFIPDAAMDWAMSTCDAVLIGAESVTRDGGVFNTIGSVQAARAAHAAGVPVFGAADLFKVGPRTSTSVAPPPLRNYHAILSPGPSTHTEAPELELVPPSMISGLLTECGTLCPHQIAAHAANAHAHAQFD